MNVLELYHPYPNLHRTLRPQALTLELKGMIKYEEIAFSMFVQHLLFQGAEVNRLQKAMPYCCVGTKLFGCALEPAKPQIVQPKQIVQQIHFGHRQLTGFKQLWISWTLSVRDLETKAAAAAYSSHKKCRGYLAFMERDLCAELQSGKRTSSSEVPSNGPELHWDGTAGTK